MSLPKDPKELFHCIFCGKGKREGLRLIGGQGIYVCEECIRNSYQLLNKITEEDDRRTPKSVPKPGEIKHVLDE
jgi:ATP-dependent Clp protease ATP-binding subunit ClpX